MARRHPIAVAIKQHTDEEARLPSFSAIVALGGVAGKLRLDRIPEGLIDDRRVLASRPSAIRIMSRDVADCGEVRIRLAGGAGGIRTSGPTSKRTAVSRALPSIFGARLHRLRSWPH